MLLVYVKYPLLKRIGGTVKGVCVATKFSKFTPQLPMFIKQYAIYRIGSVWEGIPKSPISCGYGTNNTEKKGLFLLRPTMFELKNFTNAYAQ